MRRFGSVLVAMLGVLTGGTVLANDVATKDLVSGVLEGRRVSKLTCEIVNKSGDSIDVPEVTLKRPDGSTLAGPHACGGLPNGASCTLSYDIVAPALDVAAYCHAKVPEGKFVRGSLRLEDNLSLTRAESDMQADVHAKLATIVDLVDGLDCPCWDDYTRTELVALLNSKSAATASCDISPMSATAFGAVDSDPAIQGLFNPGLSGSCTITATPEQSLVTLMLNPGLGQLCTEEATEIVKRLTWCP